jgi:hypothetical protein
MLEELELTSDTKETVRRDLAGIVVAARDSFDSVRRGPRTDTRINVAPRPGRNDPCHCGSGKKYKRCCLAHVSAPDRDGTAAEHQAAAEAGLRLSAAGSGWAVGSPRQQSWYLPGAMTDAEPELVNSSLEREPTINGITVKICICRSEVETSWILEVEDHLGGSMVWDDRFVTDKEALDAAMAAIEDDGIESFAHATAS